MGKLFLKKSIEEKLTEFSKDDYREDNEDRPRASNFKDFSEQTSTIECEGVTTTHTTKSENIDKN